MLTSACKKEVETGISSDKATAAIGEPIKFTDTQEERVNVSFAWDFGDGNKSTERNPSHIYDKAGAYTVTQTVILNKNAEKGKTTQKSAPLAITIEGPTATFTTSKTSFAVNEGIILTNTSTVSDKGYPAHYTWSYVNSNGASNHLSSSKNASVSFPNSGTYTITLKIEQGLTISETSVEVAVGGGTPATGSIKSMVAGEWKGGASAERIIVASSPGSGDCTPDGTQSEANSITTANFNADGSVRFIRKSGNQTTGTSANWMMSDDGQFLTISGGTGGTLNIAGTFKVTVTAAALTLTRVEIKVCNSGTFQAPVAGTYTETRTIALTK